MNLKSHSQLNELNKTFQSQLQVQQEQKKHYQQKINLNNPLQMITNVNIQSTPPQIQLYPSKYSPYQQQQSISTTEQVVFRQVVQDRNRTKYGNMIVFYQKGWILISLGPNYLFFLFAYFCFTLATIYLVSLVNQSLENHYFKISNFIFCWAQNLSYLFVALSNPGVVLPKNNIALTQTQIKSNRICKKCGVIQQRKTYHCKECNICIQDYDHHCPWTSKCIGGGNLKRFYAFVCLTPVYIFYYMIIFMICMASLASVHSKNLKSHA